MRWRRLDGVGSDECRLTATPEGWRLAGVAEFVHRGEPATVRYVAECDAGWRTTRGEVTGRAGPQRLALSIQRDASGAWTVNGRPAPELSGLVDLDIGFTPATNLFPLRRLALGIGRSADAEAAWLDDETWTLTRLPQRYERRDDSHYWYVAPTTGYAGMLTVGADGFVRDYPGLWAAEPPA